MTSQLSWLPIQDLWKIKTLETPVWGYLQLIGSEGQRILYLCNCGHWAGCLCSSGWPHPCVQASFLSILYLQSLVSQGTFTWPSVCRCPRYSSTAVKRHCYQGNSYKRMHLIRVLLMVSVVQSIIIMGGNTVAGMALDLRATAWCTD